MKKGPEIGNALFWKKSVFDLVEHFTIEYSPILKSLEPNINAGYPQVAIVARLQYVSTQKQVIAVCTHISANFNAPHVQLAQVQIMLQQVQNYVTSKNLHHVPIVICGDYNSTPSSEVYEYATLGKVSAQKHRDLQLKARSESMQQLPLPLNHVIPLQSSYAQVLGQEPKMTNCTVNFSGTLDFTFYTKNLLEAVAVLDIPSEETLFKEQGLPNSRFGSDHIPIVTLFKFL